MTRILAALLLTVLVGCSNSDAPFCKCLEAGEALNGYSAGVLSDSIPINAETQEKMIQLRQAKSDACKAFEEKGGEELNELRNQCK